MFSVRMKINMTFSNSAKSINQIVYFRYKPEDLYFDLDTLNSMYPFKYERLLG